MNSINIAQIDSAESDSHFDCGYILDRFRHSFRLPYMVYLRLIPETVSRNLNGTVVGCN
jgi:hypothetical protein